MKGRLSGFIFAYLFPAPLYKSSILFLLCFDYTKPQAYQMCQLNTTDYNYFLIDHKIWFAPEGKILVNVCGQVTMKCFRSLYTSD